MHFDSWEMSMDLDNARPGAPEYRIDDDNFRDRFDTEPWTLSYKRQQRDGPFWDRASVRDRYDDIRIPTFHIGGWYDGYRDSVARMLEHVKNAPVKAIIGAWHHTWPNEPYPGPGMEWRHEAMRWFDQFLKGEDTGILDEPRFAVFVRDWHPPGPHLDDAPGQWRYEDGWPVARIRDRVLYPQADHTLAAESPPRPTHRLAVRPLGGLRGRRARHVVGRRRARPARHGCLQPRLRQRPARGRRRDPWIPARDADGRRERDARQLDRAALGCRARRHGDAGRGRRHERDAPISAREPAGDRARRAVRARHRDAFHVVGVPKGHRIRLAVNNAMWPMLWPTPEPMTTQLQLGHLAAHVAGRAVREAPGAGLPAAREGPGVRRGGVDRERHDLRLRRDLLRGPQSADRHRGRQGDQRLRTRYPWGTEQVLETIRYEINDRAPADATVTGTHRMEVELPGRTLVWDAELTFRSDRENFFYTYRRRLTENGKPVREKTWNETIPRDYQ